MAQIPEDFINYKPRGPLETRAGASGYLQNALEMLLGSTPADALSPGGALAPLGMGKIPEEALNAIINARGKLFHGSQSISDILKIVTEQGLQAGRSPSGYSVISTSRSPHVSKRFGPFILELNPELMRTRPRAEPGFRKNVAHSFEAEEGVLGAPPEAIDRILVDKNRVNQMFERARKPTRGYAGYPDMDAYEFAQRERAQYEQLIEFASKNNIPVMPIDPSETKLSRLVNVNRPGVEPKRGSPRVPAPLERKVDLRQAKAELSGNKPGFTNVLDQLEHVPTATINKKLAEGKTLKEIHEILSEDKLEQAIQASKLKSENVYEVLDAMLAVEDAASIKAVAEGANLTKTQKADYVLAYETLTGEKFVEGLSKPKKLTSEFFGQLLPNELDFITKTFGPVPESVNSIGSAVKFAIQEGDVGLAQWLIGHPATSEFKMKQLKKNFGDAVSLFNEFNPGK